jgi:hypothetical protein
MAFRTVKLRRLLGATALCGGMAIAATGIGAGVASADWGGRRHRLARCPGGHRHPRGDHPRHRRGDRHRFRQDPVFRSFPADRFG